MTTPRQAPGAPTIAIGFREFVALIACLMATTALGIDTMLPALTQIGHALGAADDNQAQWIIAVYMLGFGTAQIVYGPLSDQYGRRPVLISALIFFVAASVLSSFAQTFDQMLAARLIQGLAAAAARVLAVSIVRDCYGGRQMARVMSLSFIVFLAVPVLAPSIGKAILAFGSWRLIFRMLAGFGLFVACFAGLRLPETLHPDNRRRVSVAGLKAAATRVLTNRFSLGYTLGSTLMFGALMGFINSAQQVFADVFDAADDFPAIFAGVAGTMAVASYMNSRVVERLGTRKLSHGALSVFIGVALLHLAVVLAGGETLVTFSIFQAATMASFALAVSNFNAMAMEPLGDIAGTASSIQGCLSTVVGALAGITVGQSFNGTTLPLVIGYLVLGCLSMLAVLWAERGRLFAPLQPA